MDYGVLDYGKMNWLAVLCAGLAYWLLGAIWYSAIFSKAWRSAIERHGVKLGSPGPKWHGDKINRYTDLQLVCSLGPRASNPSSRAPPHGFVAGPENWCGCRSWVLCNSIDHDLRLAIATAKTLGHRHRLPYRRLYDHGCNPGGLAVAAVGQKSHARFINENWMREHLSYQIRNPRCFTNYYREGMGGEGFEPPTYWV